MITGIEVRDAEPKGRGYLRVGISLEPIVRVEDELRASPSHPWTGVARLHCALGL